MFKHQRTCTQLEFIRRYTTTNAILTAALINSQVKGENLYAKYILLISDIFT